MEPRQQQYRAVSAVAVIGLILSLLSALSVFHWLLACIPILGIFVSWMALRRIDRKPGELAGRSLARAGMVISLVFAVLGWGWLLSVRAKEVPFGYQRVSYEMLQPDPTNKAELIPLAALELEGKRVFIKGYMYPGRQQVGLKEFLLCPAIPNCPFCAVDPKPTEMISVTLEGDLVTRYTTNMVRLGGRLHVERAAADGLPYQLSADYLR